MVGLWGGLLCLGFTCAAVVPGRATGQDPDPFAGIPPAAGQPPAAAATDIAAPGLDATQLEAMQADDACMQSLRQCCCCPNWTHYAIFDVLFLQRNNGIGNAPLVFNSDTGQPVMTAQDLYPSTATGVRLFYGHLFTDTLGWEIGYTGIYGMFGSATVTGPANLELPPPLGLAVNNFNDADQVRATYWSTLNIFEANVFCYDCCQECGPDWCGLTRCRPNCHCVDWLAGFIWAGLDEQANLNVLCCTPPEPASYNVRTSTNYFGAQIGQRGRREWCRWAVEGWWKTALCGTSAFQAADPIVGTISGVERGAESATASGVGFIGQLNGTLIYKITQHWGLRAGYNFYWLTNAALAPAQWDFATAQGAGTGINDNGTLFLHGANLGTEYRW
ncbi:MAG: hypothetical protein EBS56_07615 [Planctomycetia bacterium]|nr:hypothetical protein [Planctomycetia bacterium]